MGRITDAAATLAALGLLGLVSSRSARAEEAPPPRRVPVGAPRAPAPVAVPARAVAPPPVPVPAPPPGPVPEPPPAPPPDEEAYDPTTRAFPEPRWRAAPPLRPGPLDPKTPKDDAFVVEVDPDVGRVTPFPESDDVVVVVLTGNPRVASRDTTIQATTIVLWLDRHSTPQMIGYPGEAGPKPTPAKDRRKAPSRRSVLGDQLLGVYAQGSVQLLSGTLAFRAEELYLDPVSDYAMLVEPRLDTPIRMGSDDVPLFVRARRARIVSRGLAVFDQADVATSRASDRVGLCVRRLTVEEYGVPKADEDTMLGFRTKGPDARRYRASGMVVHGERVPIFYWPGASFGGEKGADFPVTIRRLATGSRSSLGRYALLGVGGALGPEDDPWLDWTVDVGGYTKRGPAVGLDLAWDREKGKGRLRTFYVRDDGDEDRNDFDFPDRDRWKVNLEHRSDLSRSLRVDLEANDFSDRGFNREYFETDERNHKERETYARLRWRAGGAAATFTQMAHLRDFRTETLLAPEAAFWSESLPLGAGFDLSSEARVGRLERVFDEADDDPAHEEYEALRVDVTERVFRPFDLGDVRVSPFVGVRSTTYFERTDGGDDVSRLALETGVRLDLQLHRDFPVFGGPLCLDGLRHVVDLDVGVYARAFDAHEPDDVPFFDRHDLEEDRTEVVVGVRNRLETRRDGPFGCRNAPVFDLRTRLSIWPDDVGPYGKRGFGNFTAKLDAEVVPDRLVLRGDTSYDIGENTLERGSAGVLWSPRTDLSFATGIRHLHGEVLVVWFDTYWRWSEKWAGKVSLVRDLEAGHTNRARFSTLRFSPDHIFEVGVSVQDDGGDLGVFLDFSPAIGGRARSELFDPREDFQAGP